MDSSHSESSFRKVADGLRLDCDLSVVGGVHNSDAVDNDTTPANGSSSHSISNTEQPTSTTAGESQWAILNEWEPPVQIDSVSDDSKSSVLNISVEEGAEKTPELVRSYPEDAADALSSDNVVHASEPSDGVSGATVARNNSTSQDDEAPRNKIRNEDEPNDRVDDHHGEAAGAVGTDNDVIDRPQATEDEEGSSLVETYSMVLREKANRLIPTFAEWWTKTTKTSLLGVIFFLLGSMFLLVLHIMDLKAQLLVAQQPPPTPTICQSIEQTTINTASWMGKALYAFLKMSYAEHEKEMLLGIRH